MPKKKELSYEKAMQRLEEIQQALDSGNIPIDQLAEQVKEAHELVQFCREKLRNAEDSLDKMAM